MSRDDANPKLGAGHASAMWRQGLRELRAAVYPESNAAQPPEYGIYGTKTPGEVAQDRRTAARDPEDERGDGQASALEARERQAEARSASEPRDRGPDRG
ncbi:hypothetical protein [Tautonia rosea]|uniref:hypothetical protein n=1 Tax=Tautonia rosea TaxID=2728037 RepID=UPI001474547E|nr:hypothetical protein [Tautonia rosea]